MSALSIAMAKPGAAWFALAKAGGASAPWGATPRFPSLLHYAVGVLTTAHHVEKAKLTAEAQYFYSAGQLPIKPAAGEALPVPPAQPARPAQLQVVEPKNMPPAKKGVEHHTYNKMRLIHSLAHIESYAIDLSWDILVRWATRDGESHPDAQHVEMPAAFYEDWLRIAGEEAKHFSIWNARLEELGSSYGAWPVHEALWSSALETHHSLLARLAVVHAVHEARGLDQAPRMLAQLQSWSEQESIKLLEGIEGDELTHVRSGLTWFKYICERASPPLDTITTFHSVVRANFRGNLLPPFNDEARAAAGFTPEWYLPLAVKREKVAPAAAPAAAAVGAAAVAPAPKQGEEAVAADKSKDAASAAAAVAPTVVKATSAEPSVDALSAGVAAAQL